MKQTYVLKDLALHVTSEMSHAMRTAYYEEQDPEISFFMSLILLEEVSDQYIIS